MTINVQEAKIRTATVEIKSLTVSGRQVTQALFRQLQEEDLILAPNSTFAGTPWGKVNYHPDGCAGLSKHLHVVWQKGDELRRSAVYEYLPTWAMPRALLRRDIVLLGILNNVIQGRGFEGAGFNNPQSIRVSSGGWMSDAASRSQMWRFQELATERAKATSNSKQIERLKDVVLEELGADVVARCGSMANDDLEAEHQRILSEDAARKQSYRDAYDTLEALDQLFIAV